MPDAYRGLLIFKRCCSMESMNRTIVFGVIIIGIVASATWFVATGSNSSSNVNDEVIQETNESIIQTPPSTPVQSSKITEASETQGVFRGYYEQIQREVEGSDTQSCDTFVVLDGHEGLVAYFKALVKSGNIVNSINQSGNLRINLPWQELSLSDRSKILASTRSQPVSVELRKKVQEGRGGGPCFSFFTFVSIK